VISWRSVGYLALLGLVVAGCAGPPSGGSGGSQRASEPEAAPSKTLVVATRAEPPSLNPKPFRELGLTADLSARMFNAGLTIRNDEGAPIPYLAQSVPQLNTDWQVFPDRTMETTYRLKPNLTWHDGQPLTADDFVFAYEVFSVPALGSAGSPPMNLMEHVNAPDPATLVIRWKTTFPNANSLQAGNGGTVPDAFPPLPRHLLGQQFQTQDSEAFMANPFWVSQYISAGPYKLDRWETGAYFEASAFDGHVLGKPKISRIRELFITDPNTVVANILAGEAQLTSGDSIRFNDGETLRSQWGDRGRILNSPNLVRIIQFQYRPELASTLAFSDLRVRQAIHHAVDFDSLNEAIAGGRTTTANGPVPPTVSYYAQLDQAAAHYPYDQRKTEQLMTEAGFAKGSDGVWTSPTPRWGRMSMELNVIGSPDSENEMHLNADTLRKAGFDIREVVWSPSQGRDNEFRNAFPGLSTPSVPVGEVSLTDYRSDRVPTPDNRWRGGNRGGWPGATPLDRLIDTWETSLDRSERNQAVVQMTKILTDDCVNVNLYWKLNAQAAIAGLTGPRLTSPDSAADWNIHEWEYR
jgi:peptide/nickel transport system substrate-binding protein